MSKKNEKNFLANGGTIITTRQKMQSRIHLARAKNIAEVTKNGLCLLLLSQLPTLNGASKVIKLTKDETLNLSQFMSEQYRHVYYDFSSK